ncbi:hypothetical protein D3C81_1139810 [compost metagenome]
MGQHMRDDAADIRAGRPGQPGVGIAHHHHRLEHVVLDPGTGRNDGVVHAGQFDHAPDERLLPGHQAVRGVGLPELFEFVDRAVLGWHEAFDPGFLGGKDQWHLRFGGVERHAGHQVVGAAQRRDQRFGNGDVDLLDGHALTRPFGVLLLFLRLALADARR